MKALFKSVFVVSIFIMKIESLALSIALVLWLVGLFGVIRDRRYEKVRCKHD